MPFIERKQQFITKRQAAVVIFGHGQIQCMYLRHRLNSNLGLCQTKILFRARDGHRYSQSIIIRNGLLTDLLPSCPNR
jgi:hypothetical protein